MKLQDIYRFFEEPQPIFLNLEITVCYVLSVLLEHDSYATELIENLEQQFPPHLVSDTVFNACARLLEAEGIVVSYQQKLEGRGRPRRMYHLQKEYESQARELAQFWEQYIQQQCSLYKTPPNGAT